MNRNETVNGDEDRRANEVEEDMRRASIMETKRLESNNVQGRSPLFNLVCDIVRRQAAAIHCEGKCPLCGR